MDRRANQPTEPDNSLLSLFELPATLVKPAVMACRLFNTAIDSLFYDVTRLRAELRRRDAMVAPGEKPPSRIIDFDALGDPEGSLLLIDAATSPYVHQFHDVKSYLDSPHPKTRQVATATITGVGSSALGSAALAWDVSVALKQPVLAIVPGYGVADMVLQGLGGWFGFGLFDYLNAKSVTQNTLANVTPATAKIGRALSASVPGARTLRGAPVFRQGSGSSDVLHALMEQRPTPLRMLVGHSKGALQIGNALLSLDPDKTRGLHVVTLGCPIAEEIQGVHYDQYLGSFDALGQLNMWGHWPEHWLQAWHSTNLDLPFAMDAGASARHSD